MDKLHLALAIATLVTPILSGLLVAWLKSHNHPLAASLAEETLRAVIRGVEEADHSPTKDAIQLEASAAGVESVLNPLVKSETRV